MAEIVTMGQLLCEIMRPAENVELIRERILSGAVPQRSARYLYQYSGKIGVFHMYYCRSRKR